MMGSMFILTREDDGRTPSLSESNNPARAPGDVSPSSRAVKKKTKEGEEFGLRGGIL